MYKFYVWRVVKMKKLQCELCGSIEIIKTDNDLFQCQMCGCKYTLEQAKSLISGVVETTIGNSEFNRLVSNAETQIKLGNYVEAIINTDLMMNEFPNCYQGYWLDIFKSFCKLWSEYIHFLFFP